MAKAAIVVLADTGTHGHLGRRSNTLTSGKEFKEAGDETTLVFGGAGTKWAAKLSDPDHRLRKAFDSVQDIVAGACSYCASSFGVKDEVKKSEVPLLEEYAGHPSPQKLVSEGYQVITF